MSNQRGHHQTSFLGRAPLFIWFFLSMSVLTWMGACRTPTDSASRVLEERFTLERVGSRTVPVLLTSPSQPPTEILSGSVTLVGDSARRRWVSRRWQDANTPGSEIVVELVGAVKHREGSSTRDQADFFVQFPPPGTETWVRRRGDTLYTEELGQPAWTYIKR